VGVPEYTAPLSKLCGGWVAPVVPTHQGTGSNSAGWRITKVSNRGNTCRTVTKVTEGDVPSRGAVVIHGKVGYRLENYRTRTDTKRREN
jgi:hypothetical protein